MKPINVGLLGIGTVGSGTWDVLQRNASEIERRAGRGIRITQVADKDTKKVPIHASARARWRKAAPSMCRPSSPTTTAMNVCAMLEHCRVRAGGHHRGKP